MPSNASSVKDGVNDFTDWIELHNPGAEPVSLAGWGVSDDRADPYRAELGDLAIEPGGFLLLWASGLPEHGAEHLPFSLSSDGGDVSLYAPDGRGAVVAYGEVAEDWSVSRVTDCCTGEGCFDFVYRGSPGISNVPVLTEDRTIFAAGSTWRYRAIGDPPADGWEQPGFDDSRWLTGAAPLGYGDGHIVTLVSWGPGENDKHVTTWFRTTFEAGDLADARSLTAGVLRDDGVVVYLNGVEVIRDNLPDGDLDAETLASASVSDGEETSYWTFALDPGLFVQGQNTLAVELHQSSGTSSDLGFDLRIVGEYVVTE
jgi:hypothetical protein